MFLLSYYAFKIKKARFEDDEISLGTYAGHAPIVQQLCQNRWKTDCVWYSGVKKIDILWLMLFFYEYD